MAPGKYIVYGAMIGASIAIGQVLGEVIARRLESAESNLKDDETNATNGEMREAIIPNTVGSAELCPIPPTRKPWNKHPTRVPVPDV